MYKLFIDNQQELEDFYPDSFPKEWTICKNFSDLITTFQEKGLPFIISVCNDEFGKQCMEWIFDYSWDARKFSQIVKVHR